MSTDWVKLETHVVNGAFPLQRCIGSTDHSGVFLTHFEPHAPAELALKLIPVDTNSAEAQLGRWRVATRLSHPHLLRIFQVGVCRVEELHYLYVLMEYADQTLEQVLEGRALTEHEVREMLGPMLGALEYLHRTKVAHGSLKPSNVLVVGDQLKLASDTMRVIGASDGGASAADDVHALGSMLCEALTRVRPSLDGTGLVELPAALPASFRDVVTRCLSRDPRDRPTASALLGWLRGEPLAITPPAPAPVPAPQPHNAATPERSGRRALPWVLGALALAALCWMGWRWIPTEESGQSAPPLAEVAPPATVATPPPVEPPPAPPAAPAAIAGNEPMPAVSQSSLDTIRGTLRVTVRVSVDKAGTVIAATSDEPGPSRYFERRSLEAAKQWTFAPSDTIEERSMRIRFAFTRSGVTGSATPLP